MQNNKHYNYVVGDISFCLNCPEFLEDASLTLFSDEGSLNSDGKIVFDISLDSAPIVLDDVLLFESEIRRFYKGLNGYSCVFLDEHDGGILLTDIPKNKAELECDERREIHLRESSKDYFSTNLVIKILDIPRRIIDFGGIFLHASYVDIGGEAILFTGPKEIGKSTHAALWEKYRNAEIINGDRALIRKKDGRWYAYGSPYCGTSNICKNKTLPIRAIVIIDGQAQLPVQKASVRRSFSSLLDGCSFDTWNKDEMGKVTDICSQIVTDLPFYVLKRVADESSVIALEEAL